MKSRIHIRIFGDVQGVFFRAGTQGEAEKLRISGWVRNSDDGSVEVMAEGETEKLETLLEWCLHGPEDSVVSHCEYEWLVNKDEFSSFNVIS